ncbi:unnamed protein product [Onchocerca flexuosa]|uniref:Ovule protein n=1 Tax=Onchocerca flexuosa TaxID=387005 RepID=A0A183H7G0_9BILA|nr:unnamed protein product [Onchocerca flexuosa]
MYGRNSTIDSCLDYIYVSPRRHYFFYLRPLPQDEKDEKEEEGATQERGPEGPIDRPIDSSFYIRSCISSSRYKHTHIHIHTRYQIPDTGSV